MKYLIIHKENKIKLIDNVGLEFTEGDISVVNEIPQPEPRDGFTAELAWTEEEGLHYIYTEITGAKRRELAYETEKLIEWEDSTLTVDEANDMWQRYEAEGNPKAEELTFLIAAAKSEIRERYPDSNSQL